MKANALTPGIVFSIDELLRNGEGTAAATLLRSSGIRIGDPADRAVIHALKSDGSICAKTVSYIAKTTKAGKAVRR